MTPERIADALFQEAWAKKEAEGYRYGRDALEQVRLGWDMAMAIYAERLRKSEERVAALEDLICEAAPLTWASWGAPDGTAAAYEWEKRAKALVDRKSDAPSCIARPKEEK